MTCPRTADPHDAGTASSGVVIAAGPYDPALAADGFVFDPIARWAIETPDRTAITGTSGTLTYAELETRSSQIARALRRRGVRSGDRVALLLPRGIETILTITGALRAGAAYVPLDPDTPADRVRLCLEDAAPGIVISATGAPVSAGDAALRTVALPDLLREAAALPGGAPDTWHVDPDGIAYVIFTSGTTGRPKGVPITHRSLVNFVRGNQVACIRVEQHDHVFQGFSPASDGHHEEIWPAFAAGATLVVATSEEVHDGPELGAFMERHRVTIVSCAPTLLSMVERDVPTIRRILFGAERCPSEMVRRWWRPDREILNTYGPTEATVGTTFAFCHPDEPITIGQPLPNYFCYVVDERLAHVAPGDEGELCVAGVGVSPGYLGDAARAAGRFVPNPFATGAQRDGLLYRTGDRVRLRPDGNIEWLGRIDGQVKIRGYRLELSDIESHLLTDEAIRSAVVILRGADPNTAQLVALVVARADRAIDAGACLARLRAELPAHMVPHALEQVAAVPMLPSGKVDRRAAQELQGVPLTASREIDPPRTATERWIAELWGQHFPGADISRTDDFFLDLGGYSLLAARFASALRGEHGLTGVSVRDLYGRPRLCDFAAFVDEQAGRASAEPAPLPAFADVPPGRYALATVLQGLGILFLFGFRAVFWLSPVVCAAYAVWLDWSPIASVVAGLAVHAISVPLGLLFVVLLKWLVVGRFREGSYPVWGGYFLRWWFVQRAIDIAPRAYITGTPLAAVFVRMLGGRVGHNVTLESLEVDCADVISIGDDCLVEERAWLRASQVAHGWLTIRPIVMERGCIVGVRSGVAGGATMCEGAFLGDLSCVSDGATIPAGAEWTGSPARPSERPEAPAYDPCSQPSKRRRRVYGGAQCVLALLLPMFDMIPFMCVALLLYQRSDDLRQYLFAPVYAVALIVAVCVQVVVVKWLVVGRMKPGIYPAQGLFALRKWFVDKLLEVQLAVLVPVYDTLFTRPWCIALGMKCGPRCEIAMPARMPYDLVEIGEESFLCSDCAVGMPMRRNNRMELARTVTERRVFLGNDSVIMQGTRMPADSLVGALSASPSPHLLGGETGQVWLGSPSFKIPTRERFDQFDEARTYRPTARLYVERLLHEGVRIILPSVMSLVVATLMLNAFDVVWEGVSLPVAIISTPLLDLLAAIGGTLSLWVLKKLLIGTYRPATHPLWSRFVWKTETFAMFFHDFASQLFVSSLLGTPYLCAFLRFMGAHVGRRAFIDTCDLTEFDLLSIGEDAAINFNAPLQAHLFEDRVMKLGRISIGDRVSVGNYSVVLFGSTIHDDAKVGHVSLVMKGEAIPAGTFWEGSPAQAREA